MTLEKSLERNLWNTYEEESNENFETVLQIRNTARLSCKLTSVILMD